MYEAVSALPDLDCAQVFRMVFRYVKGEDPYIEGDKSKVTHMALIAFNFIKPHLDRNQERFEQTKKARSEAGKIGGLAKQANARIARQRVATPSKIKQKVANLAVNENENVNENITTKVVGEKSPTLLVGKGLMKGNQKEAYGNNLVNYCIQIFNEEKGFDPIDRNKRGEAWNLVRSVKKTLQDRGKSTDDEKVKRGIKQYLEWAFEQDWSENIKTMSAIRRNFAVFIAKLEGGEDDD